MRILWRALLAVIALAIVAYGCDYLYARFRPAQFADVHIDRILAIAQHFNKINYERTDPVTERCVYSMFPHFSYTPCWYLMRHNLRIIKIG
jgi:hypothetical protein